MPIVVNEYIGALGSTGIPSRVCSHFHRIDSRERKKERMNESNPGWVNRFTQCMNSAVRCVPQRGSYITAARISGPRLSIPSTDSCTQDPGWMSYPIRPCIPIMPNDPCGEAGLKTIFTSFPTISSKRIDGCLHV